MNMKRGYFLILLLPLVFLLCGGQDSSRNNNNSQADEVSTTNTTSSENQSSETVQEENMALTLSSNAFNDGESIPKKYTCDGEDISPQLSWDNVPEGTQSFALISDDPDAPMGTWVHWVIYNIPADKSELQENFPTDAELSDGTLNGKNSWPRLGYGGPCPPSGTHRYYFKLYALDTRLDLESGATKEQLLSAMEGHILDQAEYMGTYSRSR